MSHKERPDTIQRVEIAALNESALFCPFCGAKVFPAQQRNRSRSDQPLPDVLFVATDEGFENRSARLDDLSGWKGLESSELQMGRKVS